MLTFGETITVFYLCFRLALRFDLKRDEACWLALAFCFGTSFVGVPALATINHLAQVVAVALLFLAINEYVTQSRLWLIGVLIALAVVTRVPTGLHIVVFMLAIFVRSAQFNVKSGDLVKLLPPFGPIVGSLAFYNFTRFGNFIEVGYSYQLNSFGAPYAV